jgi:hypothetical protein
VTERGAHAPTLDGLGHVYLAGLIFVDETAAAERPLPARRAPAHKATGIREAIEARGATLRYLPQYSPDLNPIKMPFSKLNGGTNRAAESARSPAP